MGDRPARQNLSNSEALIDFSRAIELDAIYKWAIRQRGATYRLMERYEEALVDFSRLIELNKEDKWAIVSRGKVYLLIEQSDRAIQDLDRAIQLDPENDWCRYGRAIAHLTLNQAAEARADLESAIRLAQAKRDQRPINWRNTCNLALYHLIAAQLEPAVALYQEAITSASSAQIRDAIRDLEDLLRLFPDHQSAQEMLRSLESKMND